MQIQNTPEGIRKTGQKKIPRCDRQGDQGKLLRWMNTREFGRPEDWKKRTSLRFEYTRHKEI